MGLCACGLMGLKQKISFLSSTNWSSNLQDWSILTKLNDKFLWCNIYYYHLVYDWASWVLKNISQCVNHLFMCNWLLKICHILWVYSGPCLPTVLRAENMNTNYFHVNGSVSAGSVIFLTSCIDLPMKFPHFHHNVLPFLYFYCTLYALSNKCIITHLT